ncbi:phosphatase PAP2 family protein [Vibrio agarivorans]|uniref:undecaprenyl-diphosphate phosphatase n=1 Tax=Vibrio agarivorans TaxID=153622 RepID=A0ABT7Y4E7_9VIBR|nr:phosphatase PAP2 family protein [Vibrio agarivorans]MDN2482880.1 phosphatase PAP2 family protein [Vibrio agarivorans]
MKKTATFIIAATISTSVFAKSKTETAGDIGQFALPLTALAIAWSKDDNLGMWELTKGFAITQGITHTTKFLIDAERPNGSNFDSFPSGHTAAAFSGAAFLHHRYGLSYGLPAYIASSYVGYSRVYGQKHWSSDVLVGAVLAYTVSYAVTTKFAPNNFSVTPTNFGRSDTQGILFNLSF